LGIGVGVAVGCSLTVDVERLRGTSGAGAGGEGGCPALTCATPDCGGTKALCDGCEVDLATNPYHCSACGMGCLYSHAAGVCSAEQCSLGECEAGYGNCDNDPGNGCESNLQSDPENCSTCGNRCTTTSGTPVCEDGQCGVSDCPLGFGDCDDNETNGCEEPTSTSVNHCGYCDNECDVPNAIPACVDGDCAVGSCLGTYGDCDANLGCDTNLATHPEHCGACNRDCLGGECVDGQCQPIVIADGQGGVYGVAVDADDVFWTSQGSGSVVRRSIDGGNPVAIASGENAPYALALSGTTLCWTSTTTVKCTQTGGGAVTTNGSGQQALIALTIEAGFVYWADGPFAQSGAIRRAPLSSSSGNAIATDLAIGPIYAGIDVSGSTVYWAAGLIDNHLYRSTAQGGGTPVGFETSQPVGLRVDGNAIFFTGGNAVQRVSTAFGSPVVLVPGQPGATGIELDETHVYWTRVGDNGAVMRAMRDGNDVDVLADDTHPAGPLAVDEVSVYWSDNRGGGSILRVAK
jgi:hypothetical protein